MNFLDIGFASFNLFSMMIGFFWGATMFRARAMMYSAIYFAGVAAYFFVKTL
jgi:hypothetical protein